MAGAEEPGVGGWGWQVWSEPPPIAVVSTDASRALGLPWGIPTGPPPHRYGGAGRRGPGPASALHQPRLQAQSPAAPRG